jgi:hypothetical protein
LASEKKTSDAFEAALKRELQRSSRAEAHDCPAPEVLAAYYDRSLSRRERTGVDSHLTSCARCQSMMAAIARADDAEPSSARRETAPGFLRFALRAAPIALIGAVLAFMVGTRTRNQHAQHQREMIALASPAAEMKPQFVERAPAPPPAAISEAPASAPEALALQAQKAVVAPEARTHHAHHHKKAESPAALAPEESAPQQLAKVEPPPPPEPESPTTTSRLKSFSATRSFSVAIPPSGAPPQAQAASREGATSERSQLHAFREANAERAEAPAAAAPAVAAAGAGAAVSGNTAAMATAPQMSQVSSPDGRNSWRFGSGGIIMRSENSTAWIPQHSGVTDDLIAASAPSDDVCWIVGKSAIVLRTLDGGAHWQIVRPPSSDDFTMVIATDSNNATVTASNGERYVTRDGGVTWSVSP